MDFKKYNRFFAFGCSFTSYYWPTWANIISKEFNESYNYGRNGAGNFFIFQSLMEAIIKHKINKDDLVMIMFSNVTREDRYTNKRGWITSGNLYFQNEYDQKFLDKYLCDHGYLMRDLNLVHGCKLSLNSIGCDYELMSMTPFHSKRSDSYNMTDVDYLLDFYKEIVNIVHPSVLETIFEGDWNTRDVRPKYSVHWQKEKYTDNHPTPLEHLEYLEKIFPNIKFSRETLDFVNQSNEMIFLENFNINAYKSKKALRLGEDYE